MFFQLGASPDSKNRTSAWLVRGFHIGYNLILYTFLVLKVLQSNFYLSIWFLLTLNLPFDVKWDDSGTKSEKPRPIF